jgi:agmatinase
LIDSLSKEAFDMALSPHSVPKIFGDVPPFMALEYCPDPKSAGRADAAVVGMPYDGIATFRGGPTRRAPQEIRKFSLLFGSYHLDWDFPALDHVRVVDTGDIDIAPGDTPVSYERLERRIAGIMNMGAAPLMIGGDHGVTYPAMKAVAEGSDGPMGLMLFDTHLDLSESFNDDRLTRASPVLRICELPNVDPRRVAIIGAKGSRNLPEWTPLARELGITVYTDNVVQRRGVRSIVEEALSIVSPDGRKPYVSVDIDVIDPAFAPGTNSIEPGGMTSREIITGVRLACERGFAGFDVVEVSPEYDSRTGSTSTLAARLIVEAIFFLAARKANRVRSWDR